MLMVPTQEEIVELLTRRAVKAAGQCNGSFERAWQLIERERDAAHDEWGLEVWPKDDGPDELLYHNDYQDWLVVEAEQDPVVAPSYEFAEKGYRHLRGLLDSLQGDAPVQNH